MEGICHKRMVIASDLEAARQVENTILDEVERFGYSDASAFSIRLAIEEGLNNAIKHGNGYDPRKTVQVAFAVTPRQVVISITGGAGVRSRPRPRPHLRREPRKALRTRHHADAGLHGRNPLQPVRKPGPHGQEKLMSTTDSDIPHADSELAFDVLQTGPAIVVRISGSAGMREAEQMRAALEELAENKPPLIVLDLSAMDFICSMGLGAIIQSHLRSRHHNGQVRLVNPQPAVLDLLETTRLNKLFQIYPSVEQAVRT